MARKKKTEIKPSKYQEEILNFIKHDVGNLIVEASAGCGKTSTLIMAINEIPNTSSILFCAFNKDIVKEIEKKTKEFDNVHVATVHSLGLRMLQNNYRDEFIIATNPNKYKSHVFNNIKQYTSISTYTLGRKLFGRYINNIYKLIDLLRLNLSQTEKDAMNLIYLHDIDLVADEVEVAYKVMEWGKNNLTEVDYTDMIWLPNVLFLKPYGCQYDFVFGDECQDFSAAQRELLLKCKKINTRFIFVGDESQAIYGFASADKDSFDKLRRLPNTKSLPLPISYRCAKNIVRFAQNYVPRIEYNELDDRLGEIKYDVPLEEVSDGDMILCRNNAPLMKIYNDFIQKGKTCYVRGKDIGSNLKTLLSGIDDDILNADLKHDGVFVKLYHELFSLRDDIMASQSIDLRTAMETPMFANYLDKIRALEVLANGLTTKKELEDKINSVFSDRKKIKGISLSTIHKAKGLEADNVYIACKSLMPSKSASQDWEKEQEKNLMYVAYTRPKNILGFLVEDDFGLFMSNSIDSLREIEQCVNTILGKQTVFPKRSKINLKDDVVEKVHLTNTIVVPKRGESKDISNIKPTTMLKTNSLLGVTKRKIRKLKR